MFYEILFFDVQIIKRGMCKSSSCGKMGFSIHPFLHTSNKLRSTMHFREIKFVYLSQYLCDRVMLVKFYTDLEIQINMHR